MSQGGRLDPLSPHMRIACFIVQPFYKRVLKRDKVNMCIKEKQNNSSHSFLRNPSTLKLPLAKSPSRGEFSTKGQARVRTRSVKVQKAQLSFIFIWLAADLSILFSSLKIAPKITRQKLMTDNPTSSEGKKIVQKFVFQKSSRQAAYLPSLFSTYSQLSKERKNNFQSNFSRGFYLVPKCIEKKITVALVE